MSRHLIRLAGPWDRLCITDSDGNHTERCQLPLTLSADVPVMKVRRGFHKPSRLSAETSVFVRVESTGVALSATLNQSSLEPSAPLEVRDLSPMRLVSRFCVTPYLQGFNQLLLEVRLRNDVEEGRESPAPMVHQVELEIIEC